MKLLTLFLSALLVSAPIPTILGNQEEPLEVQLKEVNSPDRIQRSVVQVPLHCFLESDESYISLCSKETLFCDIELINKSMSLSYSYHYIISGTSTIIMLPGSGEYSINIRLSNGKIYNGEFCI